jgi:hypothetical protein
MLLAALVGGILMYVWASGMHLSPLAQTGFKGLQNEPATVAALKAGTGDKPGMYFYPYTDMGSKDAMQKMTDALKTSPHGFMIYHPAGGGGMSPAQLIGEFVLELFETLLALWLMSKTSVNSFAGRVGFMAGVGVLAAVVTNASYWIWYEYPTDYTIVAMVVEIGKFVFAGIGAAFILGMKPKGAPAAA